MTQRERDEGRNKTGRLEEGRRTNNREGRRWRERKGYWRIKEESVARKLQKEEKN